MSKQVIQVIVDENGNVTIDVDGVVGTDCRALTRGLESQLGEVLARKSKARTEEQSDLSQRDKGRLRK